MERLWIKARRDLAVKHIGLKGALNSPVTSPNTRKSQQEAAVNRSLMLLMSVWRLKPAF
jgi:hypothetical protein